MLLRFASLKTSGQSFVFHLLLPSLNHCVVLNKQGVGGGKGLNTQRFLSCLDEVLLSGENDQRLFFFLFLQPLINPIITLWFLREEKSFPIN